MTEPNLEKQEALEDKKPQIDKESSDNEWTDMEIKQKEFINKVTAANLDLSADQASEKLVALEKKYDCQLFRVIYGEGPHKELTVRRKKLSIYRELNIISDEEITILEKLEADFSKITKEICTATGDDPEETLKNIDSILEYQMAKDLSEAKEILINGPIIEGFEETKDHQMPDESVRQFLKDAFGLEALKKAKVARVTKDDQYMIFLGYNFQYGDKGAKLVKQGIADWDGYDHTRLILKSKEDYLKAAMFLEETDNPDRLEHAFKVRASSGNPGGFSIIRLRSFGVEKSSELDFLTDTTEFDNEDDRMRAFMLGVIAHEIAHGYEKQEKEGIFDEYKRIIEEENSYIRSQYVSDYVLKHKERYGSDPQAIFREDFAEAVRIYITNPEYLQQNYPRRFAFINQKFPFIKAGAIGVAIKNMRKK
ncbi:MAG: hypothetical protein WC242_02450 [Candidatus Paceibacterota bacterium]|jgi:hypothetical protein